MASQAPSLGLIPNVEQLAHDLWRLLLRSDLGAAVGAEFDLDPSAITRCHEVAGEQQLTFREEPGLLINPTAEVARDVFTDIFKSANKRREVFIFAFVGHAVLDSFQQGVRLCFLDSPPSPSAKQSLDLLYEVADLVRGGAFLGFVGLIDACHSGQAAFEASRWWASNEQLGFGYELLTSTGTSEAYDSCFTGRLVDLLEHGIERGQRRVECQMLWEEIHGRCPDQEPHYTLSPTVPKDQAQWISWNPASWAESHFTTDEPDTAEEIQRLTIGYQSNPSVGELLAALDGEDKTLLVVGGEGTGKSTLAAALTRPELLGLDPGVHGPVHGIVFLERTPQAAMAGEELHYQLARSVPGFRSAYVDYRKRHPVEQLQLLPTVERLLLNPLEASHLAEESRIVVVFDGYDRLDVDRLSISELIHRLVNVGVRVVITSQERPTELDDLHCVEIHVEYEWLKSTLSRWVAKLPNTADSAAEGDAIASYEALLRHAISLVGTDNQRIQKHVEPSDLWTTIVEPVLGPLSVSGIGATVPIGLLTETATTLGGHANSEPLRDLDPAIRIGAVTHILSNLNGLIARSEPGTDHEHVGLFHRTLADYLHDATRRHHIDAVAARRALLQAIDASIKSADGLTQADSDTLRYVRTHAAEHLWALERHQDALQALERWELDRPADNLQRWESWHIRVTETFGPDHPATFSALANIARWTGETGHQTRALGLLQSLLDDQERVLKREHPDVLRTLGHIAHWTGHSGLAAEALALFKSLRDDYVRLVGSKDPATLAIRGHVAHWTGETGNLKEALSLFKGLLGDYQDKIGPDDPATLTIRGNIARWTGETGHPKKALRLFKRLLKDHERVRGKEHPETLTTRSSIARWTGETGHPKKALALFEQLVKDQKTVLGPEHPDVLATRGHLAHWAGHSDQRARARDLFDCLLPNYMEIRGRDHPDTLVTRGHLAHWTGETGDPKKALAMFTPLVGEMKEIIGRDHPATLTTRGNLARWIGETGDPGKALLLLKQLAIDQKRVLGPDHPDVRTTRRHIAHWTDSGKAP